MVAPPPVRPVNTSTKTPMQQRFGIGGTQKVDEIYVGDLFAGASTFLSLWNVINHKE